MEKRIYYSMDVLAASLAVINLRSVPRVERSLFSPALNFKIAAKCEGWGGGGGGGGVSQLYFDHLNGWYLQCN